MADVRPVDRLQAFLAAIAGDESAPELTPRDQLEYYLAKMAERVDNIQPGPGPGPEPGWQDGVAYDPSVYQPVLENQYWSQGRLVSYNGWNATQSVNCYTASQLYIDRVSGSTSIPDGRYSVFLASDGTTVIGLFSSYVDPSSTASRKIFNVPEGAMYFSLSEASAQIGRFLDGTYTVTPHA